jgi:quercetin dioxygenase-like cupin family protein
MAIEAKQLDPSIAASNVYTFINENDRMRVFKATFKPGDIAKMHHHPPHMVYVLKGGKMKMTSEGKSQEMNLEEGKGLFLAEQNHEATNIGNTIIDLLVVELKK